MTAISPLWYPEIFMREFLKFSARLRDLKIENRKSHKQSDWKSANGQELTAAAEICKEIEDFILELQQTFTSPKGFNVAELIGNGV